MNFGRYTTRLNLYTGNRNLAQPIPLTTTTFDTAQFISIDNSGAWHTYGYANTGITGFYAFTGQDPNSSIPPPTTPLFVNMPTSMCSVDEANNMSKFVTNGTSTTVPVAVAEPMSQVSNPVAQFTLGDHIEFNFDGVVRQVTAIDTVNKTITFTPALSGFTAGDGLGYPNLVREDFIENWGARTNFARDSRLAAGSPGLTMSATGGAIGSPLIIGNFQMDDFDGDGIPDVPAIPADVLANRARHNWHLASWFSFGNN